ncbi:MAG TPA: tRNA pseudouridine(55) synthase TruB [Candidatus Saccharimonadales bacterium]|nr:tRNA pseudouridine(55) synthase TruB [Candidatus Saccharimonadales bacterium]
MNGVLLIDKPAGWTSFDVVHKIRRIIEQSGLHTTARKRFPVGHTGTLDPQATGLLVLLLGTYTRRAPELTKADKTYAVTMRLGQISTTGDEEGEKTAISNKCPSQKEVQAVLQQFTGALMQTPPAHSAIKINGQRAYKLARLGKQPDLQPRPAHIYSNHFVTYTYPNVLFYSHVSSGTYIRSLVQDMGETLSTGAYMAALRRTQVGPFRLEGAIPPQAITPDLLQERVFAIDT